MAEIKIQGEADTANLFDSQQSKQKHRKRRLWIAMTMLLVTAIIVFLVFFLPAFEQDTSSNTFEYQQVVRGNITLSVAATGTVKSDIYDANFLSNGRVQKIDVKAGQVVKKGQILAELDKTLLQDDVNEAQAQLTLASGEGSADQQVAQAQLQTAQDTLHMATLTAPHDGIVTAINGTVGSTAQAPENSFIEISDPSTLHVIANVNEADIASVADNNPVQFTVPAYPNNVFSGKVNTITPDGQNNANIITYSVSIDIATNSLAQAKLYPGMTANVTIIHAQQSHVLLIPTNAVSFAQSMNKEHNALALSTNQFRNAEEEAYRMLNSYDTSTSSAAYILTQHAGSISVRPVILGLTDGTSYVVLDGVSTGDKVLTGLEEQSQ